VVLGADHACDLARMFERGAPRRADRHRIARHLVAVDTPEQGRDRRAGRPAAQHHAAALLSHAALDRSLEGVDQLAAQLGQHTWLALVEPQAPVACPVKPAPAQVHVLSRRQAPHAAVHGTWHGVEVQVVVERLRVDLARRARMLDQRVGHAGEDQRAADHLVVQRAGGAAVDRQQHFAAPLVEQRKRKLARQRAAGLHPVGAP
jgi:hypothetical protein